MSSKRNKCESPGKWGSKGGASSKKDHKYNEIDRKTKMEITKKLNEMFKDTFDLDLIASVAHTCQWDFGRSAEALMILGGCSNPISRKGKQARGQSRDGMLKNEKTKSLPSSLKQHKNNIRSSSSLHSSMPNGLKQNQTYTSSNSLSSGQVWQRHYKSKPQSPGLLTMIPVPGKSSSRASSVKSLPVTSPNRKESTEAKKCGTTITRIQKLVLNGMKVMVLMRGAPGSGKTHLATIVIEGLTNKDPSQHIFSTDDYFVMLGRGLYRYDSNQLPQAHSWNQKRVSEALRRSTNPVIVDNTHCQAWEMKAYVAMAVEHDYLIEVLEPITAWRVKEAELARRNVHFVPREKIRQMLDKYEPGWTGDKLLKLFGLNYQHCGKSHVQQEIKTFSNVPLAQHRQQDVVQVPEKPKRKRHSPRRLKKDRKGLAGVDVTDDREKQMEELNMLFAEYGTTIDSESRDRVLQSGVPISEVVARIRQLQGTVLPLPKPTTDKQAPSAQPSTSKTNIKSGRLSPPESVEPDTMSSSNLSETSEYETDSDGEYVAPKDNDEEWEDLDDENLVKSEGALSNNKHKTNNKHSGITTSSQEELSLIDFDTTSTQACSSQEELSLIDFDESSSSSEEQETQMLTLQESLKELLINSQQQQQQQAMKVKSEMADSGVTFHKEDKIAQKLPSQSSVDTVLELNDSLLDLIKKHEQSVESDVSKSQPNSVGLNSSLLEILSKKYENEKTCQMDPQTIVVFDNVEATQNIVSSVRSPDLEDIPLPCLPANNLPIKPKLSKMDEIMNSWEDTKKHEKKDEVLPKPVRAKSDLSETVKKSGTMRDKSPEKVLSSADLSWSSVHINSSWENVDQKPSKPPIAPKPQRLLFSNKKDASTNTQTSDFTLCDNNDVEDGFRVLMAGNRDINVNTITKVRDEIPAVLMLDKGSMTDEIEVDSDVDSVDGSNQHQMLLGIFPNVPHDHLMDLLEKCENDVSWAVDILLESATDQGYKIVQQEAPTGSAGDSNQNLNKLISDGKKTIKRGKKNKNCPSDLSLMLKKELEESFTIGAEHYSEKTLYYKKKFHGEFDDLSPLPLTEPELETIPEVPVQVKDDEEFITMELSTQFLNLLVEKFGYSYIPLSHLEGFKPTINLPLQLANQIYSCWLESITDQIEELEVHYEKMVQEDAAFAMELQQKEFDKHRTPDLREIMDMEMALSLYKEDQCMKSVQDSVASKLSKRLLFETFPNIDKTALIEIYKTQGGSFQKTYDILQAFENETPKTVATSEFLEAQERALFEEARQESLKAEKLQQKKPLIVVKNPRSKASSSTSVHGENVLIADPSAFRQEIHLLKKRRNDCYQRSQEAYRAKNFAVASYYSQLASLYEERIERSKNTCVSTKLFEGEGHVTTQLDLHYLFVNEAVQVLDLFLDHHINKLRDFNKTKVDLSLITGRGLRSRAGVSRIKPAVRKRLAERGLECSELNPGLLKVTVRKTDTLTNDV